MEDYGIANKLSRICSENCNKEFAATPMSILKNPQCLCESCNNEGKIV